MAVDFPERVVHGGTGKRQQEKTHKTVLDFSASVNPYPPQFAWEMGPDRLGVYPDDTYTELKDRIARVFHRRPEEICVGNGSIELIRVFCSVIFRDAPCPGTFFLETPTFGEYALSARLAGAAPTNNPHDAAVSFLCNPNNPTGHLLPKTDVLRRIQTVHADRGILFCDEAFIELADPGESVADVRDPSLFVVRSLTKCFSVPGIRFGYGFGDPALIEKIETARPPWSVNSYAETYAMEAFLHMDELAASRAAIGRERTRLVADLQALGMHCNPSQVNYILVDYGRDVSALCETLALRGILVRDCTSFGLPASIRVAVRTRDENRQLIEALAACVR
ncbi:MAG: histidinol-phosphate transaminase [Methanoregula sp.]|nr:histidinol-phosphate transaminase [Methanoregula sp.]